MSNYNSKQFEMDLFELGIELDAKQLCQFIQYYEILNEWNSFMNLTAITEFDEVMKKHFIDSLSLVKAVDLSTAMKCIDIGTGAGFPGIPIKIAFPHLKITLLDSLKKRVTFLDHVVNELGLRNVETLHGRAEDFAAPGKLREKYDLCFSRAVANLSTLCEYCIPYVKQNGMFVSYKSEKITEEMKSSFKAIQILGGKVEKQVDFNLPESDIYRNLIMIKKMKQTPPKYPRKAGVASKDPL